MTDTDAPTKTAPLSSNVTEQFVLLPIVLRCLGLALHHDYLSNGTGHQQSRRVLRERASKSALFEISGQEPETKSKKRNRYNNIACDDIERRYLAEIAAVPRLTSSEEYSLVLRMRSKGSDWQYAHDRLISANLGLVVMFAYRYQHPGLPLLDLIAEGNIGLMKAASRFDPELGYRFATYAKWWVRQSIQLALPNLIGVVRMPVSTRKKDVPRSSKPADNSAEGSDCFPVETDFEDDHIPLGTRNLDSAPGQEQPQTGERHISAFGEESSDAETIALLAISQDAEPPGAAMAAQRTQVLKDALATLGERDSKIIAGRFALSDDHVCTLEELSQKFDVSIERVRQIESSALKKLAKVFYRAGVTAETLL